ncbi:HD domain-containing protein [Candidatus Lokiarchaeum ossiferum]|uniref:HD domain-containing protein n=1 Tax=Candidatus Lokiarchaeum ossiferum TaxID=2951803 RepID=UPI00352BFF3A
MSDLIQLALNFAQKKHLGQNRKFDGTPYINHPIGVVKILKEYTSDEEIICAAYLHDTVEDTNTTLEEIQSIFHQNITLLVKELTTNRDIEKKMGKPQYLTQKINMMSEKAKLIKLADRLHNVSDIEKNPIEFGNRYAKETEFILNNITFNPTHISALLIEKIWEKINPILAK